MSNPYDEIPPGNKYQIELIREAASLHHSSLKHLATLAAGSLVVASAFTERLGLPDGARSVDTLPGFVLILSLVHFLVSVGASAYGMWLIPQMVLDLVDLKSFDYKVSKLVPKVGAVALATFTTGLILLAVSAFFSTPL